MRARLIHEHDGQRTFALVFQAGDEAMEGLSAFAREHVVGAAQLTGIGAFSDVVLGYFDWEAKEYRHIPFAEQVEVVSLVGDVALEGDDPAVHAHVVVGHSDGRASGGHLLSAHVRPTLEVVLTESPAHLRKRHDPASGLALIALDDDGGASELQGEASLPHVPDDAGVAGGQARRVVEDEARSPRSSTEEGAGLDT